MITVRFEKMGTIRKVPVILLYTLMAVTMTTGQDCTCDTTQIQEIETRVSTLEAAISQLQNMVIKVKQESNKMKKLTVATLNVALAPEEEQCNNSQDLVAIIGGLSYYFTLGHDSCKLMGTALYPAVSCNQMFEACHHPSGTYFIQGAVFAQVYCEMNTFDGGWTRFGKGDMASVWNYENEDEQEVSLTIISPMEIKLMRDLRFNTFKVSTDVEFILQADDSTNPSRLEMRSLPWLEPVTISIRHGDDHTRLELTEEGDRIACFAGASSQCGHNSIPRVDEPSQRIMFTSMYFGPRAVNRGAVTVGFGSSSEWSRNRYTWSGSYYYILAK